MAASTRTFTIRINGVDQAINSVNELEDNVRQLEEDLNSAQLGTAAFEQLRSELVAASGQLEEFRQSAAPITSSQIADGFLKMGEAAAGAIGLIGTGLIAFGASSEDVEKVQAKLQAVTATLESVKLVTEALNSENVRGINLALQSAQAWVQTGTAAQAATTAGSTGLRGLGRNFINFGKTLLSNPIFLIAAVITGILAATGNLEKTLKVVGSTLAQVFEPFGDILKKIGKDFKPLIDAAIEFLPPLIQISTISSRIFLPAMKLLVPVIDALSGAIDYLSNGISFLAKEFTNTVAMVTDFIGITDSSKKAEEDFNDTIEASIAYQKDYEESLGRTNRAKERALEVLKASGASAKTVNAAELDLLKTKRDQVKAELDYGIAIYERIKAAGKLGEITKEQSDALIALNQKYLDSANEVVVKENEISTERKQSAADRAKENQDAIDALKAQIAERLKLSEIGLGLENLDKDLQDLEGKLKKVDQTNIAGILEAQAIQEKTVEVRKSILKQNADNAVEKEKEISANLKAELDKRTFAGEEGAKEKAKLEKDIADGLAHNLEVIQSNLNQDKQKLDDDYANTVKGNSEKIVGYTNDQVKKQIDLEKAKLEGVQASNDRIVEDESKTADERIDATIRSSQAQLDIINKNADQQLIGLKEGSDEYEAVIERRNNSIVALEEKTKDKIQAIEDADKAARLKKNIDFANQVGEAIGQAVQIAQQIIASIAAEVDARIEETKGRISELQTIQDDLTAKQNALEDELQSARGQRAEDLLAQIDAASAARSAAAKKEQEQNAILAAQEEKKARLAKASAIATAIQTTVQAGLAVATAFTVNAAYPIVGVISALAFVAALVGSIASIKNAAKFEKGGMVGGKLHKDGGTLIEAEKGEFVVNRKAAAANLSLLKEINSGESKSLARKYEAGGLVGINDETFNAINSNSTSNLSMKIDQMNSAMIELANRPIYTAITDINDGTKRVTKITDSVSF